MTLESYEDRLKIDKNDLLKGGVWLSHMGM
jgi:hypothetical protein